MEAKKWMEAFGEIRESYLEEAMEMGDIAVRRKKKRRLNWWVQYASVVVCICILMIAISGGVLQKYNRSGENIPGPGVSLSVVTITEDEIQEDVQEEVAQPEAVEVQPTTREEINVTSQETMQSPAASPVVVKTEVAEEKLESEIALPEGAFSVNMNEDEIASIWGQETLKWETMWISDLYLLDGMVMHDGDGNVWTVTVYGYLNEKAKLEDNPLFTIELSPEELPPTCEISGEITETWQMYNTSVDVRQSSSGSGGRAYTRYEVSFIRKASENIGVRAVFRLPKGGAETVNDIVVSMLEQSLNPENTLQLSQLKTDELPDVKMTDFAIRLFQQSLRGDENLLISPLSVSAALAMTANGAGGETKAQMEEVLGQSLDNLNRYFAEYLNSLAEEDSQTLISASSIWIKDEESLIIEEDFVEIVRACYRAESFKEAFDAETKDEINDWVSDNTDEMIPQILDEIPAEAKMYLINAIAFDAEWMNIYYENQVRQGIFTMEDGTETDAEFMYSEESLYMEDEMAKGFIKPYKGGRYVFAALLPDEGVSVDEYAASLTGEKLYQMLANAEWNTVHAAIPRFESEYKCEMSEVLEQMGMKDAFDGMLADFTGIGYSPDGNLKINRVLHQTSFALDERGTKAGAATVVEIVAETALEVEEIKEVYLDRPFIYMLVDWEHKVPVFIGVLNQP